MAQKSPQFTYDSVLAEVEKIPYGKVATYGQIASLAGCTARQAGYALASIALPTPIPWHRVINSQGKISMRNRGDGDTIQRDLLEKEGVVFNARGKIDLDVYGYRP